MNSSWGEAGWHSYCLYVTPSPSENEISPLNVPAATGCGVTTGSCHVYTMTPQPRSNGDWPRGHICPKQGHMGPFLGNLETGSEKEQTVTLPTWSLKV